MDGSLNAFERCYCTGVTRAEVLRACVLQGCRTVEELQDVTGACTGCRTCRPELEQLLRARTACAAGRAMRPDAPAAPPDTREGHR
jgi:NAD(P)H-nitrite reductase large subunit